MHVLDWLILLVWVVTLVELIVELRRKRWYAAGLSALFLLIFTYIGSGIFMHLFRLAAGLFGSGSP